MSPGLCASGLVLAATPALAVPIVSAPPAPSLPAFSGSPAAGVPLLAGQTTFPPQNPFMAPDPNSNIHNDTWMTDAYPDRPGPLGNSLLAASEAKPPALCGSIAFDSRGRLVSVCPSIIAPPQARIIDPDTLATIASFDLPNAPDPPGTEQYQNFSGGGYFFLDDRDRIWVPTKTDHIYVIGQSADGQSLELRRDYDLTPVLDEATERITSALPDFTGRIWFVTKQHGAVGTLDPQTGRLRVIRLGEEIENSFAIDGRSAYIVSDRSMYRFVAGPDGTPKVVWKQPVPELGHRQARSGQRRLGHDADDHEGRGPRRDHRQRRSDERRRLPHRLRAHPRSGASSARCRCSSGARAPPRTR